MVNITDELKNLKNNKFNKVKSIAKKLRIELELEYDWQNNKSCFSGKCYDISEKLANRLNAVGIYSYKVMGQYMSADASYIPDMTDWDKFEMEEYFDFDNAHDKKYIQQTYTHWWTVTESRFIVDLSSDQFHPLNPEDYRVFITSIGNSTYGS